MDVPFDPLTPLLARDASPWGLDVRLPPDVAAAAQAPDDAGGGDRVPQPAGSLEVARASVTCRASGRSGDMAQDSRAGARTRRRPRSGSSASACRVASSPVWPTPDTASALDARLPDACREIVTAADAAPRTALRSARIPRVVVRRSHRLASRSGLVAARPRSRTGAVSIRSIRRVVGDSKIVWELNRHQWLVRLAQAWAVTGRRALCGGVRQRDRRVA